MRTTRVRCKRCGAVYVVAIGYPASAPHGPKKDCPSDAWEAADDA